MAILEAQHLEKSYQGRLVIADVSMEVESGQVVGLLGPNGAGKTTCFYMIAGIVQLDKGDILLDGNSLARMPIHHRARAGLGYLPQEASIFRKLSVADNIMAILETRSELTRADRIAKRDELLREFHIDHIRETMGIALSGGERRRAEIARALASEPKFMLLDEPFAGVDPISVNDIKEIVLQLKRRGIGVLITDHNVRETLDICEHAYMIGEGKVIAEGDTADVLASRKVREIYLGDKFQI